jgi:hypothetical protein
MKRANPPNRGLSLLHRYETAIGIDSETDRHDAAAERTAPLHRGWTLRRGTAAPMR